MEKREIGIGFVGAGFVAHTHAHAYRMSTDIGVRLAAVAAAHQASAEKMAGEFGIPFACDDYRRLLERDDVDIVDICVPNNLHEEVAIAAARAGRQIICEKPLTGYFGGPEASEPVGATPKRLMLDAVLASADRMLAAAAENGVQIMYAENWLYTPAIEKAKRLAAASGGTILEIRAQECHSGSHASYAKSWRTAGGGAILRLGTHPLAAAMHLKWEEGLRRAGKPIRVQSVTAEVGNLSEVLREPGAQRPWLVADWVDVENWGTVILTFDDGTRAVVSATDTSLGGIDNTFDVFMSTCRIKADMAHSTMLQAFAPAAEIFGDEYIAEKLETKAGWSYPSVGEEWLLGFAQELRDFVTAVAEGRPALSTGEFGKEVVKVVYAAYVSAEEGRRVAL